MGIFENPRDLWASIQTKNFSLAFSMLETSQSPALWVGLDLSPEPDPGNLEAS